MAEKDSDISRRAKCLEGKLTKLGDDFWQGLVLDTSMLKTTLSAIGHQQAARVLRHGYLSALVMFHSKYGTGGFDETPGEAWFLQLAMGRDGLEQVIVNSDDNNNPAQFKL